MKLTATELTYEYADASGYKFEVYVSKDEKTGGWTAHVSMHATGLVSPEAAIEHVGLSAKAFLRQLKEQGVKAPV